MPLALAPHDHLCEGSYDQWLVKVLEALRKHHLHAVADKIAKNIPESGFIELQQSYEAARFVQASIKPHLVARVGLEIHRKVLPLLLLLRKLTQPFHFMALPPELRTRIYDMVPELDGHVTEVAVRTLPAEGAAQQLRGRQYVPGITQANKQLRSETRTIFLSKGTFVFTSCLWFDTREAILHPMVRSTFDKIAGIAFELQSNEDYLPYGYLEAVKQDVECGNASRGTAEGGEALIAMLLGDMRIWNASLTD